MSKQIPASHLDLVDGPVVVMLATVMADGMPQVTPVWISRHGNQIWVNSAKGRQKDLNLRNRPYATISATDPQNPYRWIEVRGSVVEIEEGAKADEHIEAMSQHYVGAPFNTTPGEKRVIYKIEPRKVNVGG